MANLSLEDKLILVQHAILTFDTEPLLNEKLGSVMTRKEVERALDTLIATQRVRRIGSDKLQNNVSATGELAPLTEELARLLQGLNH